MTKKITFPLLLLSLVLLLTACTPAGSSTGTSASSETESQGLLGGAASPGSTDGSTESGADAPLGMGAPVLVSSITVTAPGNDLFVANGDSLQLRAEISPEQASQSAITWSVETGPALVDEITGQVRVTGYGKILVKASATDGSGVVGDTVLVGVPAAPNYTIDYVQAQTWEMVPATDEYSLDGGSTWTRGSGAALRLSAGQQILFRIAASGAVYAGKAQTLIVDHPAVPPPPQFNIDTFNDQTEEIIPVTHQYSLDGGSTWTSGTGSRVKLVSGHEVLIRVTESGLIPPGEAQILTFVKLPEHYFKFAAGTIIDYNPAGGRNVVIPSEISGISVTSIGNHAFFVNNLTSVVIPETVTSIGTSAFSYNNLTTVNVPGNVVSIGDSAFSGNALTSLTLGQGIKKIGGFAFASNKLAKVTIPDSVTDIQPFAFLDTTQDKITLGKGFTSYFLMNGYAISGMICSPSPNLVIPATIHGVAVNEIDRYVFSDANLQSVSLPSGLKRIGFGAFESNRLSSITFPVSLEVIEDNAFANNMLLSLTIPATVRYIGDGAFQEPNRITRIVMLGSDATVAMNCLSLSTSNFPLMYYQNGKGTYTGTQQGSWSYSRQIN